MSAQVKPNCELCLTEAASFYCDSDAAFLCSSCDHNVHSANFLFARHLRHPICHLCHSLHGVAPFSGPTPPLPLICPSCTSKHLATTSSFSSSSSACISTSDSHRREVSSPGRSYKGIFVNWGRRLGLGERSSSVVTRASRVMKAIWSTIGSSHPRFRVCLASSFWFGLRMCGPGLATWKNLKGLEEVASVPAKLIAVIESKVELTLTANARRTRNNNNNNIENGREGLDLEEGWAESSI